MHAWRLVNSHTQSNWSFRSEVPNPRAADRYWSVGHLVPGRTERINNLHYFRFIYYLSLNDVLFRKMTRFSLFTSVYVRRMSRRLSRSRDKLPLKAGPWKYCLTLNRSVVQRGLGTTALGKSPRYYVATLSPLLTVSSMVTGLHLQDIPLSSDGQPLLIIIHL